MGRPRKKLETGDWYVDSGRHQEDLERDLVALQARADELQATAGSEPDQISAAEEAVAAAKKNLLKLYGVGQKTAARRPAKAEETR
jgi:hypothetical protein